MGVPDPPPPYPLFPSHSLSLSNSVAHTTRRAELSYVCALGLVWSFLELNCQYLYWHHTRTYVCVYAWSASLNAQTLALAASFGHKSISQKRAQTCCGLPRKTKVEKKYDLLSVLLHLVAAWDECRRPGWLHGSSHSQDTHHPLWLIRLTHLRIHLKSDERAADLPVSEPFNIEQA